MSDIRVKICGLQTPEDVFAAVAAGASYIGFVFFEKSPRNVTRAQARAMALITPPGVAKVALVVNADDAQLDRLTRDVPLDLLQLHGTETPERVTAIRARYGLPVMKAVGIADASDLPLLETYGRVADQLLVDAKPPSDAALPGGNGLAFDWQLIAGRRWSVPWMLAGGLTPASVSDAIRRSGARQIDVSSGVERLRGQKDPDLMRNFVVAAQSLV